MTQSPTEADKTEIIRDAFDAIVAMERAHDIETLNGLVADRFSRLGFDTFAGLQLMGPNRSAVTPALLFGANYADWQTHYVEHAYRTEDACIPLSLSRTESFFWSDVPSLADVSPEAQIIFDEAAEFKMRDGLLVPMHGPDGSVSAALLAGEFVDAQDPVLRITAHTLALHFATTGRRILARQANVAPRRITLTPRQIECLCWVRDGKSSVEIGNILSLSTRTVEHYIHTACGRLGVTTRWQAVTEAIALGIIAP